MVKKFDSKIILWIVGILFVMSLFPGEGTKAASQQAVVNTDYTCTQATDCPTCIRLPVDINTSKAVEEFTFLEELAYAQCTAGTCELSEYCIVWDCGNAENCQEVKQTLLDNTIGKLQENPMYAIFGILLIVAYFML